MKSHIFSRELDWSLPIVSNGDFATRLLPNYFGHDLLCFFVMNICFYVLSCQLHCPSIMNVLFIEVTTFLTVKVSAVE